DNNGSSSYMWVHLSGEREKRGIVYDYQENRKGENAEIFLKEFKGYHQTDAYSGYAGLHDKKEITWVACWAHARRKYIEITKTIKTPGIAHKMVKYIGQLYKIEREALDKKLDPGETKKLREKNAVPILEVIKKLLDEVKDAIPPQSILGKAVGYTLNNWQGCKR
ncbi:IS66 family transposase, partial [Candidatus Aquarickettsia rohweri]